MNGAWSRLVMRKASGIVVGVAGLGGLAFFSGSVGADELPCNALCRAWMGRAAAEPSSAPGPVLQLQGAVDPKPAAPAAPVAATVRRVRSAEAEPSVPVPPRRPVALFGVPSRVRPAEPVSPRAKLALATAETPPPALARPAAPIAVAPSAEPRPAGIAATPPVMSVAALAPAPSPPAVAVEAPLPPTPTHPDLTIERVPHPTATRVTAAGFPPAFDVIGAVLLSSAKR